ncbi:MAG: right-handed parallel beta-helix repeat-containing protein [Oligoflexales bacterium]|nr:right-handed parallel beta-helix repeat-containing protein [Oligoflexales bacterium]
MNSLSSIFFAAVLAIILHSFATTSAVIFAAPTVEGKKSKKISCSKLDGLKIIKENTNFCPEEYVTKKLKNSSAVVTITNQENLTISCEEGFLLLGEQSLGTTKEPSAGFLIKNSKNILIKNCAAKGFRFGLIAQDSENIKVIGGDFSNNFYDMELGWVQDSVQGGGIRFSSVSQGEIKNTRLAFNWNGIDFRKVESVMVENNEGHHCSNTGITLVESHNNVIRNNDFSWGVRGIDLQQFDKFFAKAKEPKTLDRSAIHDYLMHDRLRPQKEKTWYIIDTKDSSGVIVDAGSKFNLFEGNDFEFGGDGIFIRRIIGNCPSHNTFVNNKTSYSPHNAIESWCDQNVYINNDVSFSHYGFWLGGSDDVVLKNNRIVGNLVDGISSQILENRRYKIEENIIQDNGRAGILLSGYQLQAWHRLRSPDISRYVNTSHIIIQNNKFANNLAVDIHLTGARGVFIGKNYSEQSKIRIAKDKKSAHIIELANSTETTDQPLIPLAEEPVSSIKSEALAFTAGESAEFIVDTTLSGDKFYSWQIQSGETTFLKKDQKTDFLLVERSPSLNTLAYTFNEPGIFDVNVFVDNGLQVDFTSLRIHILPENSNKPYLLNPLFKCYTLEPLKQVKETCQYSNHNETFKEISALRTDINFFERFTVEVPIVNKDVNSRFLSFFLMAENPNYFDWQDRQSHPIVEVLSKNGLTRYKPNFPLLPTLADEWSFFKIPLAGGDGWNIDEGSTPEKIYKVRFEFDPNGYKPYSIWLSHIAVSED